MKETNNYAFKIRKPLSLIHNSFVIEPTYGPYGNLFNCIHAKGFILKVININEPFFIIIKVL